MFIFSFRAYRIVKILHKYNGLCVNNILLILDLFTIPLKENTVFTKLLETTIDVDILKSFTDFQCQDIKVQMNIFKIYTQGSLLLK